MHDALVPLTADDNEIADARVRAARKTAYGSKEYAVEIAAVVHHFPRSNRERMNLIGIR